MYLKITQFWKHQIRHHSPPISQYRPRGSHLHRQARLIGQTRFQLTAQTARQPYLQCSTYHRRGPQVHLIMGLHLQQQLTII